MRWLAGVVMVCAAVAHVSAQTHRIHGGAAAATVLGGRGSIDLGTVPAVGAVAGVRLTPGWSIEAEIDRGFATSSERVSEGLLLSRAGAGATQEERDRQGIFGTSRFVDRAGLGFSIHAVWRTREAGRAHAALFGGMSWRQYQISHTRTITAVGPDVPANDPERHDFDRTRTTTGGGLTAGFMIPVQLRESLAIAPTVRFTMGASGGEFGYKALYTGIRVLWGF